MKIKMTLGDRVFNTINGIVLVLLCLVTLFPFLHLISMSLSSPEAASKFGLHLIPEGLNIDAYKKVFENDYIFSGYANTIINTILSVVLSLMVMTLMAYALSKKHLVHRTFFTGFVVFTMFFQGGLIPSYLLIRNLGLMDNRLALILPVLVNTFNMLIIRNYFMTIPADIEEAAVIDGANDLYIFARIMLPLSMPIIATVALWVAVERWNAWFDCLLYIRNPAKYVLQVLLQRIVIDGSSEFMNFEVKTAGTNSEPTAETIKAATIIVSSLPIMCVYPFIQKYFVKGVMVGSLKG